MNENRGFTSRQNSVASQLMDEVRAATYPIGSIFPNERELQARFGVGRHTIREALKILTEKGLLARRRKTGTVVLSYQPMSQYVQSLRDIRNLLDVSTSSKLEIWHEGFVSMSGIGDDAFLKLEKGRWFRIAGVRMSTDLGKPLCWSEIMIPACFAPERSDIKNFEQPFYEAVQKQFDLRIDYVQQKISAAELPPKLADVLGAVHYSPALLVIRRYVANDGVTFEVTHNLYPADRYAVESIIRKRS